MDHGTAIAFAAGATLIVGFLSSAATLIIGWRQTNVSRLAAEAAKVSADSAQLTATSAGDRAIATMRLAWIEQLRKVLAEYHSILVSYKDEDYRRVSDLGTQLDLMLNLDEADQKALWDVADKVFRAANIEERIALDQELMAAGRKVLKNEWRRIKRELRGEETAST